MLVQVLRQSWWRWARRAVSAVAVLAVLFSTFDIHLHASTAGASDSAREQGATTASLTGHVHSCTHPGNPDPGKGDPDQDPGSPDQPATCSHCVHVPGVLPIHHIAAVAFQTAVKHHVWIPDMSEGITHAPEPNPDRLS